MRLFQVDAFTDAAFSGNPAAVCLLDRPAGPSWMQKVAAEVNLPMTAFVERRAGGYGVRWFTAATEVLLCGHATLASAHVLVEEGLARRGDAIRFDSASGPLVARRDGDLITLDFPARPAVPAPAPGGLLAALGVTRPAWTGHGPEDALVVLDREEEVTGLTPDLAGLTAVDTRGAIVTAPASRSGADFVSRFFAPAIGVPEDPVTGSAHCTLAQYWGERLGRPVLTGYQASPRGGTVRVRWEGDRVTLAGHAVTVYSGTLAAATLPQLV
ncbi:MAG TPA: PhzF family phenazine biosynthesis protein [Streptosporangiaceae bacterium]